MKVREGKMKVMMIVFWLEQRYIGQEIEKIEYSTSGKNNLDKGAAFVCTYISTGF